MEIKRVFGADAALAQGIVVVIDVIRAFSVAAYAFGGGVQSIKCVRKPEEAFMLKQHFQRSQDRPVYLAGEVQGRLIENFDFNNSPAAMERANVQGALLIQRTGAGTQGAVNAVQAQTLCVCSLTTAAATASYVRSLAEETGQVITLMPTEIRYNAEGERVPGVMEDVICADYLQALINQQADAAEVIADGVQKLKASDRLRIFGQDKDFPADDVPAFLAVDRFPFVMVGIRKTYQDMVYIDVQRQDIQ
jgi:2-phosphosulfolactate phosphatase